MENLNKKEEKPNVMPIEQEWSLALKVEQLEAENEALKNKSENMTKLFRIIAHDLINPIGNAAVVTKFLLEDIKYGSINKAELAIMLESLSKDNEATLKLLEDLLIWSRLQQDGMKIEVLEIKLSDQVNNAISPLQSIANQKNIKLTNEVPNDMEIFADSNMLQTVIRNLCSNSLKFTKEGGEVSVSAEKINDKVEVSINDNGVGMTNDQIKKLFENAGVSTDGTNKEKGTGFGISICKELVEKMGGSIRVESEGKDKGTKFIVSLSSVKK